MHKTLRVNLEGVKWSSDALVPRMAGAAAAHYVEHPEFAWQSHDRFLWHGLDTPAELHMSESLARCKPRHRWVPCPNMHKTATIDYGIVPEGDLWLILNKDEACLQPGEVIRQRGTNRAPSDRPDHTARIAFMLIDAGDGIARAKHSIHVVT